MATQFKDKKPLLELLRINPNVKIYLENREDPLPVNLSHFRAELTDTGVYTQMDNRIRNRQRRLLHLPQRNKRRRF